MDNKMEHFSTMIGVQIPNGYSWTLTTKLGHILNQAESLFGQRDLTCTILGIEFFHLPRPQVWYPETGRHISIQLTIICLVYMNVGVYQLAHEVVHCLSPTGGQNPANVIEEGIATYFSVDYAAKNGHGDFRNITDPKYQNAYNLYSQLIAIDADIIKKVRQVQPTISLISASDLTSMNNLIPQTLANDLIQIF